MKSLILIDGNALLHRAFHATPLFTTSKGEVINAVYGFSLMLLKILDEYRPTYIAVAWDMRAPTFRHSQFENYKANRGPADENLSKQYDRVFEVLKALNIPEFKLPGFEADDLVGTLAALAQKKGKSLAIIIATGDRDIMQLINKQVKVLMPKKTLQDVGLYGEEEFILRFGFEPRQLIDYKSLAGDASDNIPGVPGIGEVSATKLIQKYQTLDSVYSHLDEIPQRLKQLLESGKNSAFLSQRLVTIETNIPIKLDLKKCLVANFKREKVLALFQELEFKSLIPRIPGEDKLRSIGKGLEPETQNFKSSNNSDLNMADNSIFKNSLISNLDNQVELILQQMSKTGVLIDIKFMSNLGESLRSKLSLLEENIYSNIGHQINLNSPKQLSEVLFDQLDLPVIKKTKTGRSTDEETLTELSNAHPVVPMLLEYRGLFKLVSTYIDTLPKYLGNDGRIHSTFNVEGAATGRLSSQNPNLQNIPIKGELGSELRKAFIAPEGRVILSADYSQIELRIMAHLADDPGLKKAFQDGVDIHTLTASKIFKVPIDKISKSQRVVGKTMNFATLYGQGPHALSRQLKVDYKTAQDYIAEYFTQFPQVKNWMSRLLEKALKDGFTETIWGRRRYIPELKSPNRILRAFGERAAVNHPVQGTAADMIKKAMVEINKILEFKVGIPGTGECRLILQVHDELLFECGESLALDMTDIVKEKMENALVLSVPVVVEVEIGQNWGEMKPVISD